MNINIHSVTRYWIQPKEQYKYIIVLLYKKSMYFLRGKYPALNCLGEKAQKKKNLENINSINNKKKSK